MSLQRTHTEEKRCFPVLTPCICSLTHANIHVAHIQHMEKLLTSTEKIRFVII